jgi:hypothetical protein
MKITKLKIHQTTKLKGFQIRNDQKNRKKFHTHNTIVQSKSKERNIK